MIRSLVVVLSFVALAGCSGKKDSGKSGPTASQVKDAKNNVVGGVGKVLATGAASELRLSPNGSFATYLVDAEKPHLDGIPPQMRVGELWAAALDGAKPRRLGSGVTNVPGGWLFSADGRWALLLEGFNPTTSTGNLVAVDLNDAKSQPVSLGTNVSYVLASPDSRTLAFVAGGVLKVGAIAAGPFRDVAGEVSTADFSPDSKQLLFRRRLGAAGGLFLASAAASTGKPEAPRKLGDYVGDYVVSPDGQQIAFAQRSEISPAYKDLFIASGPDYKPKKIANQTADFSFSADSKYLARIEGFKSEIELGDLYVGPANGTFATKVGDKVGPFTFSPDSKALAYLEYYDPNARAGADSYGGAGVLGRVDLPDGKPRRIGNRVPNYAWGSDSRYLAFLSRFFKPIYSVDLMLFGADAPMAVKVRPGSFGYSFGPKNSYLLYRSNCIRGGRACDLFRGDPAKIVAAAPKEDAGVDNVPQAAIPEEKILEGLYTFGASKDGNRLLVTYPRWETKNFDVAVLNLKTEQRKTLDSQIILPAVFAADDGSKVAYIINDGERSGVYLATDVP